jgi:uncharacterized protein YndB with AHSA1/START domain
MSRIKHLIAGTALAAGLAIPQVCRAAVMDSQVNGFAIEQTLHIAASPEKVYATLIQPSLWWSSRHTFSHSAANLSMDARGGGCFCEKLPKGGSVQHATIVAAEPGVSLRLRGPLGPFQGQGVDSAITFTLTAKDGGTDLALENIVGGYMEGGFGNWPQAADGMLSEQIARLKSYLETGSPEAKER